MVNATRYPYDLTNVTNTENIFEFVQEINKLSGEYFMVGMLFAGFVILFITLKKTNDNHEALIIASFITAVLTIFFRVMDFISTAKTVMIMVAFVGIFAYGMFKKD